MKQVTYKLKKKQFDVKAGTIVYSSTDPKIVKFAEYISDVEGREHIAVSTTPDGKDGITVALKLLEVV